MKWTYTDAINLALDEAMYNPATDVDDLANEIWAEMQADNAA